MSFLKKLPGPISILMAVIVIAAGATWMIPSGEYNRLSVHDDSTFSLVGSSGVRILPLTQHTLDSLKIRILIERFKDGSIRKPVAVPGSYHKVSKNGQGIIQVLEAPVKGIYESIEIIFFILVIGSFMFVFNESGAMVKGIGYLSHKMIGRERWLLIILTFLFSFGGSSYGMAEEAFVFYPIMIPLFLAAGYDLLIPVAVIFGGTQIGSLSSFSNPFATIIASNAAGVSWKDGLNERLVMFIVSTAVTIWYFAWYAEKIKKNPKSSIVLATDGVVDAPFSDAEPLKEVPTRLGLQTRLMLLLFLFTFLTIILGVVFFHWWLTEMTTLFIGSSILVAFILRMRESEFVRLFIKGAASLLPVSLILGVARGVTIVMGDGRISDSVIYYSSGLIVHMPQAFFILSLLSLFLLFTLFIASSSGMAVLTMPIMGALALIVNIPGSEVVNAYLYGMGVMGFVTPVGLILPALAMVNISLKAWLRFITPLLIILTIVSAGFLLFGLYMK